MPIEANAKARARYYSLTASKARTKARYFASDPDSVYSGYVLKIFIPLTEYVSILPSIDKECVIIVPFFGFRLAFVYEMRFVPILASIMSIKYNDTRAHMHEKSYMSECTYILSQ